MNTCHSCSTPVKLLVTINVCHVVVSRLFAICQLGGLHLRPFNFHVWKRFLLLHAVSFVALVVTHNCCVHNVSVLCADKQDSNNILKEDC